MRALKDYVNVWTITFVVGAALLTAMPFLQRRFLSAPPPLGPLGAFTLVDAASQAPLSDQGLRGKVLLLTLAPSPCDDACAERSAALARGLTHTDDLGDRVLLLTVALPGATEQLKDKGQGRYHVATGTREQLEPVLGGLRAAWARFAGTDAGTTSDEFSRLPAFAVVDQEGQVRGFWREDAAGRGNAINAARLLARYGVKP